MSSFVHLLRLHVETRFGPATWRTVALAAGLPDDSEVADVVPGTDQALEGFGRFLFPAVLRSCSSLLDPAWGALDLLEHVERALRAGEEGASVTRDGNRLVVVSSSQHRVCPLARGVVQGVGDHFRTPLDVRESTCVRRGDDRCVTTVSHVAPGVPAQRLPQHDVVPTALH